MEKKQENLVKWGLGTLEGKHLLPSRTKTIKVGIRTWDSLKSRKKENETFNDVIKGLLMERTKSIGNDNIKVIKYERKINFFDFPIAGEDVGFEFEYNDIKDNKSDFILDLKIKKVFFGRKSMPVSEFFGVDDAHKHYSNFFLLTYITLVRLVLSIELKIYITLDEQEKQKKNWGNLVLWRQLYYNYNLSEESFKEDIEEPLKLSEEETPSEEWKKRIENSTIMQLVKKMKKE